MTDSMLEEPMLLLRQHRDSALTTLFSITQNISHSKNTQKNNTKFAGPISNYVLPGAATHDS